MGYAIYRLMTTEPTTIGLPRNFEGNVIADGRFITFGKTPVEVQVDLFKFVAEQRRITEDESFNHIVTTEGCVEVGRRETDTRAALKKAYTSTWLERVEDIDAATSDLLDEALEILKDKDVTRALALASNPYALVKDLMAKVAEIKTLAENRLSMAAVDQPEEHTAALEVAVDAYRAQHRGMRFVTLAKHREPEEA
ncbi:hypothetical protein D3C76_26130 [compost metagenome]